MSSSAFTSSMCKKPTRKEESCAINDAKGKVMGTNMPSLKEYHYPPSMFTIKCTTPLYKLTHFKSLPKSVDSLPPEAQKTFLENEFGSVALISSLRCCGACYARLHRLSSSVNKSVALRPCLQTFLFKIKLFVPRYHVKGHQNDLSGGTETNLKPVQGKK